MEFSNIGYTIYILTVLCCNKKTFMFEKQFITIILLDPPSGERGNTHTTHTLSPHTHYTINIYKTPAQKVILIRF